jgi:ABC-type amino acid transport substrate-binding protein
MSLALPKALRGLLIAGCSAFCWPVLAGQVVHVGGAHFPPYVVQVEQAISDGLLIELLAALNQMQGDYRFVLQPTAVARRFRDFEQGRIDMAIFENPDWGWQGIAGARIDMGLEDAEIFVARVKPGRKESFFANLAGKRLALFSGYHYGFADFNSEQKYLIERFNAQLTYSHDSNLLMVLRGRADIALITRSYLGVYLKQYPQYAGQLLASQRVDQVYRHYALLRPEAPISANQFSKLLQQLRENGTLEQIFGRYQIQVKPVTEVTQQYIQHIQHIDHPMQGNHNAQTTEGRGMSNLREPYGALSGQRQE